MIQAAMYFVLGLLSAGLLALLVTPAIWRRAMRLTRQRIEHSVPMTLAEIEADKDHLRAEHAMATRRLETNAERLREKTTEQVFEINAKRTEIVRLSNECRDQAEKIGRLDEALAKLDTDHRTALEELGTARALVARHEADLIEQATRIARLDGELTNAERLIAEQKLELASNATQIGNLTEDLRTIRTELETMALERDQLAASLAVDRTALSAERRRSANLEAVFTRNNAEHSDRLAAIDRQANAIHTAGNVSGDNIAKAIAAGEAEKAELAEQLARVEADNELLRAENLELRSFAGSDWDMSRENSVLRDSLRQVASDVLKLSQTISGNGTENGRIAGNDGLNAEERSEAPPGTDGSPENDANRPAENKPLAERLRALRHTAVRH